jgi:hypothetical protein
MSGDEERWIAPSTDDRRQRPFFTGTRKEQGSVAFLQEARHNYRDNRHEH